MFEAKYFSITKLIKEYKEDWRNPAKSRRTLYYDTSKIQLSATGNPDYDYLKKENSRHFYLQCLLHGAMGTASEDPKTRETHKSIDYRLQDFLIQELRLLWGMYCFIDPAYGVNKTAQSYYLLGPFSEDRLKPSFTFPHFINTSNFRDNVEFHKIPDNWMAFYIDLNAVTRENLTFETDFVKFFGTEKWKRNDLEESYNLLYISSGEIDHAILQWLFCYLRGAGKNFKKRFEIVIGSTDNKKLKGALERGQVLTTFLRLDSEKKDGHEEIKRKIVFEKDNKLYLGEPVKGEPKKLSIYGWLKHFGLLRENSYLKRNGIPTERLITSIEFFYYHIAHWNALHSSKESKKSGVKNFKTKNYFSVKENKHYYDDCSGGGKHLSHQVVEDFLNVCQETLPVVKDYFKLRKGVSVGNAQDKVFALLISYFKVLEKFAEIHEKKSFAEHCRFNVISHFFQRHVLSLYDPILTEQTCRGFIITPIFSNPEEKNAAEASENLRYLGYFLGIIKDSDAKGRCYFNWRVHSDDLTVSRTTDYFYNDYLFYLQDFVFRIGFNEVKEIYYKGIEANHKREIERQSTRAAISQVMARNMSHNIGSHVLSRLVTDQSLEDYLNYCPKKNDK